MCVCVLLYRRKNTIFLSPKTPNERHFVWRTNGILKHIFLKHNLFCIQSVQRKVLSYNFFLKIYQYLLELLGQFYS